MTATDGLPTTTSRRGLLVGLAAGLPVVAFGVRGMLVDAARTHPGELARWIVGAALVNDLVVVPVILAAAWLGRRLVGRDLWPVVRAGLVTTGALALVGWPFVRGYGADPGNPSLLPRSYGAGLAAAIAAVWLVVAALALARRTRRRRHGTRRVDAGR
ncbi:MAG TPA: hypothetical protein VFZ79_06900 [Acidimicrobiales bacterium]